MIRQDAAFTCYLRARQRAKADPPSARPRWAWSWPARELGICAILLGADDAARRAGRRPDATLHADPRSLTRAGRHRHHIDHGTLMRHWRWTGGTAPAAGVAGARRHPGRPDPQLRRARAPARRARRLARRGRRLRRQRAGRGHSLPPRGAGDGALSGYRWGVERKRALPPASAADDAADLRHGAGPDRHD